MRKILLAAAAAVAVLSSCSNGPKLYSWEKGRDVLPEVSEMTLCYGGSEHRNPYLWDRNRLAPMVTALDAEGQEQWLFDSFLGIEFCDTKRQMSFGFGYPKESATRESWQALIDYWFAEDNGFDALNKEVGAAIERIGAPNHKRTFVMTLPDPMMYKMFNDSTTTSVYWGELNGRELDFKLAQDRIDALKWYVDEVRAKVNEAKYENIEFLGFYIISEDLAIPGDGWSAELKHYEDVFPAISDYIHSCNEGVYWIPYFKAAPYTKWRELGIDLCIMQPNHYWDLKELNPMEIFFQIIEENEIGMELEFDVLLEGSDEKAMMYKQRFRDYLNGAKENGVWGTKPFALYSDTDAFYDIAHSEDATDKELFREFIDFLLQNPLRRD